MKTLTTLIISIFLAALSTSPVLSQSCKKFHLYGSCMQFPGASYKMDGQSRSNVIGVGDKLIYNVIFYGKRDYKLFFCATDLFNPVHFRLMDGSTKELIYDSKKDAYPETIELSIENTRNIMVEIAVLAENADKQVVENYFGCVGFLVNWREKKR